MRPSQSERRYILVPLLGRTPQVLTEALNGLCVDQGVPLEEGWAISTQEGRQAAADKLLHAQHGKFLHMQKDYPA